MHVRTTVLSVCLGLATLFVPGSARAQYQVTNLVSNQEKTAKTTDPLLVNAWGLTYGPGGPFWISDNGSGWSTLYSNTGAKIPLDVFIPTAGGMAPVRPRASLLMARRTSRSRDRRPLSYSPPLTALSAAGRPQ